MIKVLTERINSKELKELASEIGGFFIKVVIDLEKEILAAGAKMHADEEQLLIENGSKKDNLWGGGYDLGSQKITYDSIINNKPGINTSSDILNPDVRIKFGVILKRILNV